MGRVSKWLAIAGLMTVAALPAYAQTAGGYLLPATTSGVLTVNTGLGGWSFSIVGCSEELNSVVSQSCANEEVIPTLSNGTLSLAFSSSTGGAVFAVAPGFTDDLGFTVNLTGPTTGIQVTSIAITGIAASAAVKDLTRVSAGESVTTLGVGGVIEPGLSVGLAGSGAPTLASQVFSPIAPSITEGVDLRAQGAGVFGNAPGTSTLTSVTLTYSAPEPVSASLLAVGAFGIGIARRRSRRKV
jgi:hypothetical protein